MLWGVTAITIPICIDACQEDADGGEEENGSCQEEEDWSGADDERSPACSAVITAGEWTSSTTALRQTQIENR